MDLRLIETGNGGDLIRTINDLNVINGLSNYPYLALFGGNVAQSTPQVREVGEDSLDWFGNVFLDTTIQFNSATERTLNEVALNSSGRVQIEDAIKEDLEFFRQFGEVKVSTAIVATDKLKINISLKKFEELQEQIFEYIWDSTIQEFTGAIDPDYTQPRNDLLGLENELQHPL